MYSLKRRSRHLEETNNPTFSWSFAHQTGPTNRKISDKTFSRDWGDEHGGTNGRAAQTKRRCVAGWENRVNLLHTLAFTFSVL